MIKKIIIGNWKMNPISRKEAREIASGVKKVAINLKKVTVVLCPPVFYLGNLIDKKTNKLQFGAQDVYWEEKGAYTGWVSPIMLKEAGVELVILGHSERRAAGEDGEMINRKIKAAIKSGLKVVLCVGEKTRDIQGHYLKILEAQLREALAKIPSRLSEKLVIAYEPVWAIGKEATGVETPEGFRQNAIFIRKILSKIINKKRAMETPILYGGSVDAKNAESFLKNGEADGLLVGRASLSAKDFGEILKIAEKVK
ncbi:MAG: triose-phosphate isomerase [Candidatus Paceibacterota bacterium]|jgi:triosephosphate isomerase